MARIVVSSGLVVVVAALLATPGLGQSRGPSASEARQAVSQLRADLREAQALTKGVADRRTRERLELLLTRAELRASELQNAVAALDRPTVGFRVITAEEFAPMLQAVKSQSFDNGRLSVIASFGTNRRFTSAQAKQFVQTFSFDNDRVKAAVRLYPILADPENFYAVLEAFTFDSGRNAVREQLKIK